MSTCISYLNHDYTTPHVFNGILICRNIYLYIYKHNTKVKFI